MADQRVQIPAHRSDHIDVKDNAAGAGDRAGVGRLAAALRMHHCLVQQHHRLHNPFVLHLPAQGWHSEVGARAVENSRSLTEQCRPTVSTASTVPFEVPIWAAAGVGRVIQPREHTLEEDEAEGCGSSFDRGSFATDASL